MMIINDIEAAVAAFAEEHQVARATAVRGVVALAALSFAYHLPKHLLPGLLAAADKALTGSPQSTSLEGVRVSAWEYLDAKHGTSTRVADAEDKAVRLLIGIAWDEELPETDVSPMLDYFGQMLGSN